MRKLIAVALLLAASAPVHAWNNKGHMVTARLAWKKLTDKQRTRTVKVLENHPHYDEFLAADRPDGFAEDEWVFLRAATWPDWVRNHHTSDFHHGAWHYINYPFVPPGSHVNSADHQPAANEENIVTRLPYAIAKLKNGNNEDRAVFLCWVLHLVGDIHQPLHCTALFSERFPHGDQGGNLALIRIHSSPLKLHAFWDGLLGKSVSPSSIGRDVKKIEDMLEDEPDLIKGDIESHKTIESWAQESLEMAKKAAYLNGKLKVANAKDDDDEDDVPMAPASYARNAGRVARIQVGKAGQRLADLLAKSLGE
ncbi:MAG TPA: S1/P1 nuclease [Gemmataceae bacterium]|jgi:hypothetical protein